ncbi:hypothetical protein [Pseudooceanicola sp.]|uniref:hypothetical protein n=1 Tax=Pseudooceanicola sp. TaxID=1914328 RepID=UPI0035C78167
MTYFTQETLVEAKLQLARAALRVWRHLPTNVAGDILRSAEENAADPEQGAEHIRDMLYRALNDLDPEEADLLALAEATLGSWHRVSGMAAAGTIARGWQDIAYLEGQNETDAFLRFDFLIEEYGKGQADAMAAMQERFADQATAQERHRNEVDRARTRKRLTDEKTRRNQGFSLSRHS